MPKSRLITLIVVGALVTSGCGGGSSDPSDSPEPRVTVTAEPTATPPVVESPLPDEDPPGAEAPFVGGSSPDTAEASDSASLSPVQIRFGVHDGFDRVVLDLAGTGVPGWLAQYEDAPSMAGSGDPVVIEGDAFLTVYVRGVVYPFIDGAVDFTGDHRLSASGGGVVQEIVYGNIFEGQADIFIGLSSEQPFRVFTLEDPPRVVIDILHP